MLKKNETVSAETLRHCFSPHFSWIHFLDGSTLFVICDSVDFSVLKCKSKETSFVLVSPTVEWSAYCSEWSDLLYPPKHNHCFPRPQLWNFILLSFNLHCICLLFPLFISQHEDFNTKMSFNRCLLLILALFPHFCIKLKMW